MKLCCFQLIWDQITSEQYRGEITRIAQEAKPHLVRLYHAHTNPENVNEMRRSCKTLSFGALYGAVAGGLHPLVRLGKRC